MDINFGERRGWRKKGGSSRRVGREGMGRGAECDGGHVMERLEVSWGWDKSVVT